MPKTEIFYYLLYFLMVALFITGPALPDITLTLFIILTIIHKRNFIYKINEAWIILLLLLWLWFIFISFFAYNFEKSIKDAIIFLRFILFIILSVFVFKDIKENLIKVLLYFILLCCVFVSLDSLYQFYNYSYSEGFGTDIFGRSPDGLYGRLSGPFADLVPGSYLSRLLFFIIILYALNLKKIEDNYYYNYLIYISLSLILSVIYFSGERMALATSFLGYLICIIFTKDLRKIIIISSIISFCFILININFHPHYKNIKIINSTAFHEGLIIERTVECDNVNECTKRFKVQPKFLEVLKNFDKSAYGEIYMSAFHMWSKYKFTGIGLNNYNIVCENEPEFKKYNKKFGCTSHPHNLYIQALTETGIFGLILFIITICAILYKINLNNEKNIKYPLISAYLTIFWPIMSTGSFLKNWNMVFICFVISLCIIISRTKKLD